MLREKSNKQIRRWEGWKQSNWPCCAMLKGYFFESQKQNGSHQKLKCMFKRIKSILQREWVNGDQALVVQSLRRTIQWISPILKSNNDLSYSYLTTSISLNIRECVRRRLSEIRSSLEGMNCMGVLKECVHRRRRKNQSATIVTLRYESYRDYLKLAGWLAEVSFMQ